MKRTAEMWWAWHDQDQDRWSADEDVAKQRCQSWVQKINGWVDNDGPSKPRDIERLAADGFFDLWEVADERWECPACGDRHVMINNAIFVNSDTGDGWYHCQDCQLEICGCDDNTEK